MSLPKGETGMPKGSEIEMEDKKEMEKTGKTAIVLSLTQRGGDMRNNLGEAML
jgi:hypothetical protein